MGQPLAFLSYTRRDNEFFGGAISALRRTLELGVQVVTGDRDFEIFQDIPGFNEDSGKMSCVWRWVGFGWPHDSRRLSYRRGSQSADRAGSRRFGRRSRDKARQRAGAVG